MKDIANNPLPNAPVLIDLSQCADLRLSTDQHDPGAVVNCQARALRKLTDGTGTVTFTLLGGSTGYAFGGPTTLPGQAKIYVPPYLDYGVTVSASAFDLDAILGVSAGDLSSWLKDFASGMPWARSDYDCSGSIGASDLSLWLEAFASGAMDETCGSVCP